MEIKPKQWREKNGRPIHDGDCHFWGSKICTCGLLHHLMPKHVEDDWFWEELFHHEIQLRRVPKPEPLKERTKEEEEECEKLIQEMFAKSKKIFDDKENGEQR